MAKYQLLEDSQVLGSYKFKDTIVDVPDETIPAETWKPLDAEAREAVMKKAHDDAENQRELSRDFKAEFASLKKENERLLGQLREIQKERDSATADNTLLEAKVTSLQSELEELKVKKTNKTDNSNK